MAVLDDFDQRPGDVSRRAVLAALAAVAVPSSTFAQSTGLRLAKLNCFEMRVSDVPSSVAFYQGLFGMPVQARQGGRVCLRIGEGPQFMAVRPLLDGETPAITHIGYSVEAFDADRALAVLERSGFERISPPSLAAPGIDYPMRTWMRMRGDTIEVYFADARGLIVQLSSPDFCGGSGIAGDDCARPEPVQKGLMRLRDLNHFTVFVNDGAAANNFYQQLFGLSVQAYQGPPAPVTGIGDGFQFVMYAGAARDGNVPANIHHGCFNMPDFDVDRILSQLSDYGLRARGDGDTGPLMHYVSLRMPERGGAEGGTPELYFTDPDGILLQLQDSSYCGGGGYLGNECLSA